MIRMLFFTFILFSILVSGSSWACEIELPERFLISENSQGSWTKNDSSCSTKQIEEIYSVLIDQNGNVPTSRIQAALGNQIKIFSKNNIVLIENVTHLIRSQFSGLDSASISIHDSFQGPLIELEAKEQIQVVCHPCQFHGSEHLKFVMKKNDAVTRSFEVNSSISKKVPALRLSQTIPAFSDNISSAFLVPTEMNQGPYTQFFTDVSKLKFYKTNKMIKAGNILKQSDLVPINIVKAGERVEITFENNLIKVKSQALSRQNGGIGDSIEVWNQSNGKKYKGIITDFNKVKVNL
jgi:flagella basal body P-ring formation protein FlgA